MTWQDSTTYSRGDTKRVPTCWTFRNGDLSITVVKAHRMYPGEWVMHCYALGMDAKRLGLKDVSPVETAQEVAIGVVKARLDQLANLLP